MAAKKSATKGTKRLSLLCLLWLISLPCFSAASNSDLDLHSIPISTWLNNGNHTEIPWDFRVDEPYLRIDQRLEVFYSARIDSKALIKTGKEHELFLISRVSTPDGEWLNQTSVLQKDLEPESTPNLRPEFFMRMVVQPGDYMLWAVLYDRTTGRHNVTKHHFKVSELHGDPLPDLYRRMPLVEFAEYNDADRSLSAINSLLYLPVRNRKPIEIHVISMLSPPEQWTGRSRAVRLHNDDTIGAMAALSQVELASGRMSVTGLDLVRRKIIFEQDDFHSVKWDSLMDAVKRAQSPDISTDALQGSKNNGAFFRDYLDKQVTSEPGENPLRVFIVVTSSTLFENGSDLRPLQVEGDCHCRTYYLRFRLSFNDVFDQLEKLMKPLHPRTFNLMSARDLRNAIAEIVEELGKL